MLRNAFSAFNGFQLVYPVYYSACHGGAETGSHYMIDAYVYYTWYVCGISPCRHCKQACGSPLRAHIGLA